LEGNLSLNRLFVIPHLLRNPKKIRKMTNEYPESSIEIFINILQAAHWPRTDARKMAPFSRLEAYTVTL